MPIVLLSLLGTGGGSSGGRGDSEGSKFKGSEATDIIPKERKVEVELIEAKDDDAPEIQKPKPKVVKDADKECPGRWYGGIGVITNSRSQGEMVSKVFQGYPADLAGLQVGDVIIDASDKEIIGLPGTTLKLTFLRNGKTYAIIITRGKICYKDS